MYADVAWVLVSLGTQVQPQIMLDPEYLPDYISVSYDYASIDIWKNVSVLFASFLQNKAHFVMYDLDITKLPSRHTKSFQRL